MTDQTATTNADNGTKNTDADTQQKPPATTNADTTALTGEGKEQTSTDTTALTGEGKVDETKTETKDEGECGDAKAKSQVPEKYEFKVPEGVQLDEAALGQFSEAAKELGLSQEHAQKLVDKMAPVLANRTVEAVNAASAEWVEAQKTDKEFGGEKLAENLGVARKAMEAFASPELVTLLNQTRLGNHPEVIRAFYRMGKAISEDTFVSGNPGQAAKDPASVLFPTMTKSA